jgi:succinate-semialdehyde dehydrogenase/glutarate-semialdehyde dehydrogenase
MVKEYSMLIGKEWTRAVSGDAYEVINPATGSVIATVPKGGREDAEKALKEAVKAFDGWSLLPSVERTGIIRKGISLIRERKDEIAELLTLEQGRPIKETKGEVNGFISTFEYYAEEAGRIRGEVILASRPWKRDLVIKEPVGVVAAIVPWNMPLNLAAFKVAPALAVGCTVVLKPASEAPLAMLETAKCFVEAGLPPGVLNVVTGPGSIIGEELVRSPISRKVAFTGELATGKRIMELAAQYVKRITLELGSNSPLIVLKNANVDMAVEGGVWQAFRNMGQVCVSINRIYVEEAIADKFIQKFVERTKRLKIGDPMALETDIGSMMNKRGLKKVMEHIEDAVGKGAEILCGGKRFSEREYKKGFFFEPTVLIDVNHNMKVMREETFGPIAPIMRAKGLDEAIRLANDTIYGLAAYLFTNDLKTAIYAAEKLKVGRVGINDVNPSSMQAPFGGYKQSGIGREKSPYGLEEYLEIKHVGINIGDTINKF